MATRTTNDLVASLRDARPRNCTQERLLFLCVRAADEIDRLQKVIDDYVYIAAASAREIKQLSQSYARSDEKRCDSDMCGATRTDMERERLQPGGPGYTSGISAGADSQPTLTEAERASVVRAIETLEGVEYLGAFSTEDDATAAATLRGLLERMK